MDRLLLLDNHDSFTWNLWQYLEQLGVPTDVVTSDEIAVEAVLDGRWRGVVLGPGPGRPEAAGITLDLVRRGAGRIPMLGVCLGLQSIAQAFGARIVRAGTVVHGWTTEVRHDGSGVFAGLPSPFAAARYHSLVVDPETVPAGFVVHARAVDGTIQGMRHETMALEGVQFHPEAILSEHGHALLANWLRAAGYLAAPVEIVVHRDLPSDDRPASPEGPS